jgi:hypothetical protein
MKKLIIGFVLLSTTSVFAQKLKYENLPRVEMSVYSVDRVSNVDTKHEQSRKQALDDLKAHVESTLGRQVIEAKCDTPLKDTFSNEGFAQRKSTCSVSFL